MGNLERPYGECVKEADPLADCLLKCESRNTIRLCNCKTIHMSGKYLNWWNQGGLVAVVVSVLDCGLTGCRLESASHVPEH